MAYKSNYATGDLIDASTFQELVNSAVYSFASLSALTSAISSPIDGQIAFAQDTEIYYRYDADSTSWVALFSGLGDITAVNTASNSGLAGGGASGSISLTVDPSNLADGSSVTVDVANDLLILEDATDGTIYKVKPNQISSGGGGASVGLILALG
tara:strand:+ start:12892 stop:13356 length:465 start_codon:yes stop_codon:yes gene_type:complete